MVCFITAIKAYRGLSSTCICLSRYISIHSSSIITLAIITVLLILYLSPIIYHLLSNSPSPLYLSSIIWLSFINYISFICLSSIIYVYLSFICLSSITSEAIISLSSTYYLLSSIYLFFTYLPILWKYISNLLTHFQKIGIVIELIMTQLFHLFYLQSERTTKKTWVKFLDFWLSSSTVLVTWDYTK